MSTNNSINLSLAGIPVYNGAGVFSATTTTLNAILYGGASNSISNLGPLTNGQLAIGSTGTAPVAAALTAGAGISIVNAAGSITIATSGGGMTWSTVTGTTQAIVADNGYVANNAAVVTFTLPATASVGDTFIIEGLGAGGWSIAQNAGQLIHLGSSVSTTGTGGSVSSTNQYDAVTVNCIVANTTWTVRNAVGNLTIV